MFSKLFSISESPSTSVLAFRRKVSSSRASVTVFVDVQSQTSHGDAELHGRWDDREDGRFFFAPQSEIILAIVFSRSVFVLLRGQVSPNKCGYSIRTLRNVGGGGGGG